MDKCQECGMPLDDKSKCTCNEEKCVFCCECGQDCDCKCHQKAEKLAGEPEGEEGEEGEEGHCGCGCHHKHEDGPEEDSEEEVDDKTEESEE